MGTEGMSTERWLSRGLRRSQVRPSGNGADPSLHRLTPEQGGELLCCKRSSQGKAVINLSKLYANITFSIIALIKFG